MGRCRPHAAATSRACTATETGLDGLAEVHAPSIRQARSRTVVTGSAGGSPTSSTGPRPTRSPTGRRVPEGGRGDGEQAAEGVARRPLEQRHPPASAGGGSRGSPAAGRGRRRPAGHLRGRLATTALEAVARSPVLRATAAEAFQNWQDLIAARLTRAGLLDRQARDLAASVLATLEGAELLARVQASAAPLEQAAGSLRLLTTAAISSTLLILAE